MARKNDYKLYLISRKYVGQIITSQEALKIFGYSKKTYVCDTLIMKYLEQITKYAKQPKKFIVRDFAALNDKTIDDHMDKSTIKYREKRLFGFRKIRRTDLYLVPRILVPFWLLKEYGGEII
jgi:hypothetical protein